MQIVLGLGKLNYLLLYKVLTIFFFFGKFRVTALKCSQCAQLYVVILQITQSKAENGCSLLN